MPEVRPDTSVIAAVASAPGHAPRALLRLSGPGTAAALDHLLEPEAPARPAFERGARRACVRLDRAPGEPGGPLSLPVMVLRFVGPRSYTGEDSAELLTVANPALLQRVTDRLTQIEGVRLAGPGEFTARAYLAGRLSLAQAEGVAATIAAQSTAQLDAAQRLLSGETGRVYHDWADELATLLALVEAGVDFTDQEDVVPIEPVALARRVRALHETLSAAVGPSAARERGGHLPRVVLAGVPNAGKSTLFNALLGRPRAVVSDTPGTTRDALEEPLDLSSARPGAGPVTLIDPAGLDEAIGTNPIDAGAQSLALAALASADLVIQCDPSGRFVPLGGVPPGATTLRVRTKADLPPGGGPIAPEIEVCALDGYHLPVLRRAIADAAVSDGAAASAGLVPRHRRALVQAAQHLAASLDSIDPEAYTLREPELVAGELRLGLNALAELVGDITPDDVIGRVFATFCVGK